MKYFIKSFLLSVLFLITAVLCVSAAEYDGYIVKLKPGTPMLLSDDLQEVCASEGIYKTDTLEEAEAMAQYAEYIEPDYTFYLDETTTYDYSSYESLNYFSSTDALFMQNIGLYGKNVKVGIVDSGIYPHNAIKDNIKGGYNYEEQSSDYSDTYGHGTAVASIIASSYGDYSTLGIAPKCDLYSLKCFTGKTSSASYIASAVYAAANTYDVDILNLSIGSDVSNLTLKNAIDYALGKGIIIVASAGNDGTATLNYPAAYSGVIGVGALNSSATERAYFSNYSTHVYCTAVGSSIKVCGLSENTYTSKSGTSFSCPVVVGIIVNMIALNPDITVSDVQEILANTCTDMGETGYDTQYGYGKVNARNIVNYMLRNEDFYISPKDTYFSTTVNPIAEYRIWKNPNLTSSVTVFWNEYNDDGSIKVLNSSDVSFENGYEVVCGNTNTETLIKTFAWYDTENIRPLPFLYEFEGGEIEDLGDY